MLELNKINVSYGNTQAVIDLDLSVGDGEAVALLGANGAGKTSTLRAASRLIPASGEIVFDGQDVSKMAPEELARRGLVHVPEGRHVFGTLTVEDNLKVGSTARNRRQARYDLAKVYDLFPALVPLRKRFGWSLSGGEQQMVAIGRGLMSCPRLLMLDEPSLGLAPVVVKAVYRALAEVKGEMAILLVEQNASVALGLCDKAYVLMSGELALSGTAEELSDREALLDSYLGHKGDKEAVEAEAEAAEIQAEIEDGVDVTGNQVGAVDTVDLEKRATTS